MASAGQELQFGVFLPIAQGGWILSRNKPPVDASFQLNKRVAILADELGFDFVLSMMKWRGFGGETDHWGSSIESMILMSALTQVTSRVKIWCTVHTLLHHPAVTAKMIATLDHASEGRAGLNVVAGGYRDEFDQMGMWPETLDHDRRYDLASEWIEVVTRLWTEERVTFNGEFFKLKDCRSDPKPLSKPRPTLISAGMSKMGLRQSVRYADAAFIGGKDDLEIGEVSRRAKAIARESGRSIKTYIYCVIVPGETDAAAQAHYEHIVAGVDHGAVAGMANAYFPNPRDDGAKNSFAQRAERGFMAAFEVGSAETLRRKLRDRIRTAELDGLMVVFPDFIADQRFFGEKVLPGLRADFA